MALFFVSIALGLIIVAVAVGLPYWRTHHRMREPYDKTEARSYLDAKDRAGEGVLPDQPARPAQQVPVATRPVGTPRPAQPRSGAPESAETGAAGDGASRALMVDARRPGSARRRAFSFTIIISRFQGITAGPGAVGPPRRTPPGWPGGPAALP